MPPTRSSRVYKNYDEQVDQAVSKMDDEFADQYRQRAEDVRQEFVGAKKEVQVEVAAAGVVRASENEVKALLFLNQYVTTDGKDTSYSPTGRWSRWSTPSRAGWSPTSRPSRKLERVSVGLGVAGDLSP